MRPWAWIMPVLGLVAGVARPLVAVSATGDELLRDARFARGFNVLSPAPGQRVVERRVLFAPSTETPVWDLAQWNSQFSLAKDAPKQDSDGAWELSDPAKKVRVSHPGRPAAELLLGVDSRPEYARPRRSGEPWPHLLLQQTLTNCPSLAVLSAVRLRLQARISRNEVFRREGYRRELHCAQCPLVLIVQNRNRESPGWGGFFWFQVPLFDDRWPFAPPHVARDTADPSAKLIYNPGLRAYTDQTLNNGDWVALDLDLLPHLQAGLQEAWRRGYLRGSRNPGDYRITSFIVGWEVPGINRAEIRLRGLSLRAVRSDHPTSPAARTGLPCARATSGPGAGR